MSRAYRLINNGRTIGHFPSLDEAMRAAQDRGFVRRADEDEGGPAFAVLVPTVESTLAWLACGSASTGRCWSTWEI